MAGNDRVDEKASRRLNRTNKPMESFVTNKQCSFRRQARWGWTVLALLFCSAAVWGAASFDPMVSLRAAALGIGDVSSEIPGSRIVPNHGDANGSFTPTSRTMNIIVNVVIGLSFTGLILLLWQKNRRLWRMNIKIREGESLYRSIVEDQLEIICRFNKQFKITFINDAFCTILQRHRDELVGSTVLCLIPPNDHEFVNQVLSELTPENPVNHIEYLIQAPDGRSLWHDWTIRAVLGPNGSIKEYQATGRDITDLRKTHEILLRTKEEAEQANRAKSDFLARMSHELRTPLNSVIGFASLLIKDKEKKLSARDINFLNRILANGKHLLNLINQILDLSKIESGRMDIEENPVWLNRLVLEIFDQMEDQIRGKKIDLFCDIPDTIAPITTDESKLRQILINLIGNAVKFTEQGSVAARVRIDDLTNRPIQLDIIDTGIGVAPERLPMIFEPFKQGDSSTSRIYGGTGLGLTISKSLCHLLGFRLEAESRPGEGSCFRIVMDQFRSSPAPERIRESEELRPVGIARAAAIQCASLKGKTALIIDDEQDARILLQHMVEEFGCKTICASSGMEGLELASRYHPDIILMDVLMPEMNGWELLINLKSDPELSSIPVAIASIVASDLRGVSLGLVDLLDKPVNPEKLLEILLQNLRESRGNVFVFEGDKTKREQISALLESECFDVYSSPNLDDAKPMLATGAYDLLLVDVSSSGREGWLFVETVSRDSRCGSIPIIAISSETEQSQWKNDSISIAEWINQGNDFEENLKKALNKLVG